MPTLNSKFFNPCSRLGYPDSPQKVVLDWQEVEEQAVELPGKKAGNSTGNGVQDEMVGGSNNGGQDNARIDHADGNNGQSLPPKLSRASEGNGGDGESNKEGVAEVKRRHGG